MSKCFFRLGQKRNEKSSHFSELIKDTETNLPQKIRQGCGLVFII